MALTRRALTTALLASGCASGPARPQQRTFEASDGRPVTTFGFGRGSHVVLLVPGGHGQGAIWEPQARQIAGAGLRVVAMDHRGFGGDSENVHRDVQGVARQLRAEGARTLSAVGASWGGWAVGTAAIAQPGLFDRLVLLAHSDFEHPEKLGGRKLFIVARDDPTSSGGLRLTTIQRQFDLAPQPKALVLLDGASHAQRIFGTPEGPRLLSEIVMFLKAP